MKPVQKFLLVVLMALPISVFAQKDIVLKSPDDQLVFSFQLTKRAPLYRVTYQGKVLVGNSTLGLSFQENGDFGNDLKILTPRFSEVNETYELVVGKTKTAIDHHRQVVIPMVERSGAKRHIDLVVRVFNDGVAFRYAIPEQPNWSAYTLLEEKSTFNLAGNPMVHTLFLSNTPAVTKDFTTYCLIAK